MYASDQPPFNFLGHLSDSQKNTFSAWSSSQTDIMPAVSQYHQIRSQQLRKTAGALEYYYSTLHTEKLQPSFQKKAWSPGPEGHFAYENLDDQQPMVLVSSIKKILKEPLQVQDEAVFHMNHVRRMIEKQEDLAQQAYEASSKVADLLGQLTALFDKPQYQAVLVKESDTYQGVPRFRVHPLDPPTPWELAVTYRNVSG